MPISEKEKTSRKRAADDKKHAGNDRRLLLTLAVSGRERRFPTRKTPMYTTPGLVAMRCRTAPAKSRTTFAGGRSRRPARTVFPKIRTKRSAKRKRISVQIILTGDLDSRGGTSPHRGCGSPEIFFLFKCAKCAPGHLIQHQKRRWYYSLRRTSEDARSGWSCLLGRI